MACFLPSCSTAPKAQDPFDVALGMAALGIIQEATPTDATMEAFSKAVAPPTVIQQTVVQEAPKTQPGGGQ